MLVMAAGVATLHQQLRTCGRLPEGGGIAVGFGKWPELSH